MTEQSYIEAVNYSADAKWKIEALRIVSELAATKHEFTTDDVWEQLDKLDVSTHEPRAMGAVMTTARRMKLISSTLVHVISTRPACHSRPIKVWKSEIL